MNFCFARYMYSSRFFRTSARSVTSSGTRSSCKRTSNRTSHLASALSILVACGPEARGPEAFAGAPLRTGTQEDVEFEVIAEGTGEATKAGDWVMVHYRLLLEDGTVVDSSHGKKPLALFAGKDKKMIEGFQRGVIGMKPGELRRIRVPYHLGYGERNLPKIPAKSTLVFELELLNREQ